MYSHSYFLYHVSWQCCWICDAKQAMHGLKMSSLYRVIHDKIRQSKKRKTTDAFLKIDTIYNSYSISSSSISGIIKPHIQQYMDQSQYCKMFITLPFQRLSILCQPIEDPTGQNTKMGAVESNQGLMMLDVS